MLPLPGLQVQLRDEAGPLFCFDFGWGAFKQSLRPVQQLPLTDSETTYQHVRLHELKEEDSLSYFLSMMASIPATMAVILINSEDSYRLSDKFHTEDQSPPVPMLVVTQETGRELLRLVRENPREVEVKVVLPQSLPQSLPLRTHSSMSGMQSIYMYMYMYIIYMYIHVYTCIIYVHTCTYMYMYCMYMYVGVHVYTYIIH